MFKTELIQQVPLYGLFCGHQRAWSPPKVRDLQLGLYSMACRFGVCQQRLGNTVISLGFVRIPCWVYADACTAIPNFEIRALEAQALAREQPLQAFTDHAPYRPNSLHEAAGGHFA